jgi:hypothetical protein
MQPLSTRSGAGLLFFRWLVRATIACIGFAAHCAAAQDVPAATAAWTLMVYLDADNDLERPMMKNLEDMVTVGSTNQVNIIVLAARSVQGEGKYTNDPVANLPNWTTAKLLRVEAGKLRELADWGRVDMGDATALKRFVTTAMQGFPANHYAVLFGDHGMAWAGVAVSESMGGGDSLGIDEMAQALKESLPAGGRFDLVGFDACVMSNLEVAKTLAPVARYLVASEEIEASDGWDYATLLGKLTRTPSMDGEALGRMIVDTYRDYYAKAASHERAEKTRALTLSLIDLDQVDALDRAITALGTSAATLLAGGGHPAWLSLAEARNDTEEYGRSAGARTAVPGSEIYDIVHAAENIKRRTRDKASIAAAGTVIAAARKAVLYRYNGTGRPHANGLSVFFPPDQDGMSMRGKTSYDETSFAAHNAWYPFLTSYVTVSASPQERNRPKPAIDPMTASGRMVQHGQPIALETKVHADDIDEVNFVVSLAHGTSRIILGSVPLDLDQAGDLKEDWDGQWFAIGDHNLSFIAPITSFEELTNHDGEQTYWAAVPAQLKMVGTHEWLDVTLYFMLDFKDEDEVVSGEFVYAVQYEKRGPRQIDLETGDSLRPVYEVIDANGASSLQVSDDANDVIQIDDLDDLEVRRTPVPPGRYQVGFDVSDLLGRHGEQLIDMEVK